MENAMKPLHLQLQLHNKLVGGIIAGIRGISDLAVSSREVNHPLWLLVHITEARCFFARQLGVRIKPTWGNLDVDENDLNNPEAYPSLAEITTSWEEITKPLMARLTEISETEMMKPFRRKFPIHDGTKFGLITFFVSHEGYHIGQLGAWWKRLGEGPLATLY